MKAALVPTSGRPEWLALRQKGVGATDAAAILGKHPWRSPIEVYLDKLGMAEEREPTEAMEMGLELEPVIARRYVKRTGRHLMTLGEYTIAQSPEHPWAFCSPDRITLEYERLVELKAPGFMQYKHFGEEGTDDIPEQYLIQCLWSMEIMGLARADLAALIGGQEMKIFHVPHDAEVGRMMVERVGIWWERHIIGKELPEIDATDAYAQHLAKKFARNTLPIAEAQSEAHEIALDLYRAIQDATAAEERQALAQNRLKAMIADAEGLRAEDWKVTWRKAKDGSKTDHEAVAHKLRVELERRGMTLDELNAITKAHTAPTIGSRRFLFTYTGEASE